MRYTRLALLLFGAGLLLGLAVVSANLGGLARVASLAMAAGVTLLPAALVADWWRHRPWREPLSKPTRRRTERPRPKRQAKSSAPRKRRARAK